MEPGYKVKQPNYKKGEMFARVVDNFGNERFRVYCEDAKIRLGRIRGKLKKRVWFRKGDLIIINPWDFETNVPGEPEKCEMTWRYRKHEITWLKRKGVFPEILSLNNIPV